MSTHPHQPLVDTLAEVIADPEEAKLVARGAGLPRADLPAFTTARLFWERVVEAIVDGKTERGLAALAAEAAKLYPHNEVFTGYRPEAGGDGVGAASPSAPAASRFGAVDNRGASIGQQVIVQGNATFASAAGAADEGGSSARPRRSWLRWLRSRRARRGLGAFTGGLALVAVTMLSSGALSAVCRTPGLGTLCPEAPSEAEQDLWQRALETSSGDGLRKYLSAYPRGFHVEEAQVRLAGCRIEKSVQWEDDDLSTERSILPRSEPYPTEKDARRNALERAREDASQNACIPYRTSSLYRLSSTSFEPKRWDCRPRRAGHACTVHGHAVCEVQRRKTVETEICNETQD